MPLVCIHSDRKQTKHDGHTLCQECIEAYNEDQESYWLYGDHPDGVSRWKEIEDLMKQEHEERKLRAVPAFDDPSTDDVIPF